VRLQSLLSTIGVRAIGRKKQKHPFSVASLAHFGFLWCTGDGAGDNAGELQVRDYCCMNIHGWSFLRSLASGEVATGISPFLDQRIYT